MDGENLITTGEETVGIGWDDPKMVKRLLVVKPTERNRKQYERGCPVCSGQYTSDDTLVIFPNCERAMHRSCGTSLYAKLLIKLLKGESSPHLSNEDEKNKLLMSVEWDDPELVERLLEFGNIKFLRNREVLNTPLITALDHRNYKVARFLVQAGCDINKRNVYGLTALQSIIWRNYNLVARDVPNEKREHLDMVNLLLSKGAYFGENTTTVLDLAMRNKNYRVAWLLIKHGVPVDSLSQNMSGGFFSPSKSHLYEMVKDFHIHGHPTTAYRWYEMLASLGYPIRKEEWVRRGPFFYYDHTSCIEKSTYLMLYLGRLKNGKLDLITPTPEYKGSMSDDYKDNIDFFKKLQKRVLSLSELCISSIRKAMVVSSGNRSILGNIEKLELPTTLKRALALEDFSDATNVYMGRACYMCTCIGE